MNQFDLIILFTAVIGLAIIVYVVNVLAGKSPAADENAAVHLPRPPALDDMEDEDMIHPNAAMNMTRRGMHKMEKKRMKNEAKAYLEAQREAKKEREAKRNEILQERELEKAEIEEKKQKELAKIEAERRRIEADIAEWRSPLPAPSREWDSDTYAAYMAKQRVVSIAKMANSFGIPYKTCQSRVAELKKTKKITGIFDEQGAFVYITDDEWRNITTYLKQNGKTSIDDLQLKINELVKSHK